MADIEAKTLPGAASDLSRTIPYWFLALVGLIYASGFLVVSSFLETHGLRDAGSDLWKIRYIRVGVFCLMLTAVTNAVPYFLKHLMSGRPLISHLVPTILIYIQMELGLFGIAMFARHVGMRESWTPFLLACGLLWSAIGGLIISSRIERMAAGTKAEDETLRTNFRRLLKHVPIWGPRLVAATERFARRMGPDRLCKFGPRVRWLTAFIILCLLRNVAGRNREIIDVLVYQRSAFTMLLSFTLLLGWLPWTAFSSASRLELPASQHRSLWLLLICLLVPTYYFALVAFSHAIFPFIPAVRGGGDYSAAPRVRVYLKEQAQGVALGDYLDTASPDVTRTKPTILLEETATNLFVAGPDDDGGPCQWRMDRGAKPRVLSISRDAIGNVQYFSPVAAYVDCSRAVSGGVTFQIAGSYDDTFVGVEEYIRGKERPPKPPEYANKENGQIFSARDQSGSGTMVVLTEDSGARTSLRVAVTRQHFYLYTYWSTPVIDKGWSKIEADLLCTFLNARHKQL
jgi:hypothetical protein